MCGRFTLTSAPAAIAQHFGVQVPLDFAPRYNIAPTQPVLALMRRRSGEVALGELRWGLVPHWAKDPSVGSRMINARAESLAEKPAYREAFERRRCLVLADGFYEWMATRYGKQPMHVRPPEGHPFAFAGLWERWRGEDGEPLYTCAIVTTDASEQIRGVHDRMPVMLGLEAASKWLDAAASEGELSELLRPYSGGLDIFPVSPLVNSVKNDVPECVWRVDESEENISRRDAENETSRGVQNLELFD